MKPDDEALRQELRDFILCRLSARQASALTRRISSDPDVARAYANVKLLMEMEPSVTPLNDGDCARGWLRQFWKFGGK